jgi:xylulose-5-phosphate/fructose-6-phosphate phosphoketolase
MLNKEIENLKKYFRAANYLSAIQIYLKENHLLQRKIQPDDIKARLLGHWGTCPGINFTWATLNWLINKYEVDMFLVVGPGHGFPAVQANLFLEGTLGKYFKNATENINGIQYIARNFSWPYAFPSHSNPEAPGVILEGGELGYALSTSYGAVLDNPDLIVACLIGDGEAETAATATAWHVNKFLDPKNNGAVLPILHRNGYKISGPTVFGRMSDKELRQLFSGYGYEPYIINDKDPFEQMIKVLEKSYKQIRKIQEKARNGKEVISPRWPMIILETPKGWTGPKEFDGEKLEGNCAAHQVVLKEVKTDSNQREALEKWLRSYNFDELFMPELGFVSEIKEVVPRPEKRMGDNLHTMGGERCFRPLIVPDPVRFAEPVEYRGFIGSSCMRRAGDYLAEVFKLNKGNENFRFFSPDETYSNKLDKIFEETGRAFVWPHMSWDKDLKRDGRVIEMLSEHTLQGLIQGYVLSGRHGVFASYEAFIQVVSSMADQYAKFMKIARTVPWRGDVSSLNYILTSSGWRQEHNGFSHQNPGFIDDMLQRQGDFVNIYFPADGNLTLAALEKMLSSKKEINLLCAGKTNEPRWLSIEEARKQIETGIGVWNFASDEHPDIVLAAAGDYLTKESLAAITYLKKEIPDLRIRFVNILTLSNSNFGANGYMKDVNKFNEYFTHDRPVIFNFHGYPQTCKQILFDYANNVDRFVVKGYVESGSITTPFDMHVRNGTSRFCLVIDAINLLQKNNFLNSENASRIRSKYADKITEHKKYIIENGVDMPEIETWQWTTKS